jgi:hypothetical protein
MAIKRRAREHVKERAIDRGERGAKKSMPIADIHHDRQHDSNVDAQRRGRTKVSLCLFLA